MIGLNLHHFHTIRSFLYPLFFLWVGYFSYPLNFIINFSYPLNLLVNFSYPLKNAPGGHPPRINVPPLTHYDEPWPTLEQRSRVGYGWRNTEHWWEQEMDGLNSHRRILLKHLYANIDTFTYANILSFLGPCHSRKGDAHAKDIGVNIRGFQSSKYLICWIKWF